MSGRHNGARDDDAPLRLAQIGSVVVRGMARGVKDVLRRGPESRHRAVADGMSRDDHVADGDDVLDVVPDPAQNPRGATRPREVGGLGRCSAADQGTPQDDEERRQMPSRGSTPLEGGSAPGEAIGRTGSRRPSRKKAAAGTEDASAMDGTAAPDALSAVARDGGAVGPVLAGENDHDGDDAPDGTVRVPGAEERRRSGVGAAADEIGRDRRGPRLRDRFGREVIGVVVLVVLAVVCAGLIAAVVVKTRNDAAAAAREAAAYRPPAVASSAPAGDGPIVVVVADEAALRAGPEVGASGRWPQLLASVGGAQVTTIASAGAGYATTGADTRTFVESAARVPAAADFVLFVGGAADGRVSSLSLARAATQAFSAALERAPGASILVVGPIFRPSGTSVADLAAVRSTLRSATRIADVQWVDPIASKWVSDVDGTTEITAAKERAIANRLSALVRAGTD